MKHTPGPWTVSEDGCTVTAHNGGTLIVETSKASWLNLDAATHGGNEVARRMLPQVEANAKLIAAAPDMAAALANALKAMELARQIGQFPDCCLEAIAEARAALASIS